MELFSNSDNDEPFFSFHDECIVLRENAADSGIDTSNVSNAYKSDWSGWSDSDASDGDGDGRDRNRWTMQTRQIDFCQFTARTGVNIADLDVADTSQLAF